MTNTLNLSQEMFGRLRALKRLRVNGRSAWLCQCSCSSFATCYTSDLRQGKVQSCGCLKKERVRTTGKKNTTHGNSQRRLHRIWYSMHQRCYSTKHNRYHRYGARGITVDPAWFSFQQFEMDMGEPPTTKHTLDRKNNNGNYCKTNCRWATAKEQAENRG